MGLPFDGPKDVIGGQHQRMRFDLCFDRKRQVDSHLIAVEVSVESLAN